METSNSNIIQFPQQQPKTVDDQHDGDAEPLPLYTQQHVKIVELLDQGLTAKKVMKELGVTRSDINFAKHEFGLTRSGPLGELLKPLRSLACVWDRCVEDGPPMHRWSRANCAEIDEALEALDLAEHHIITLRKLIGRVVETKADGVGTLFK